MPQDRSGGDTLVALCGSRPWAKADHGGWMLGMLGCFCRRFFSTKTGKLHPSQAIMWLMFPGHRRSTRVKKRAALVACCFVQAPTYALLWSRGFQFSGNSLYNLRFWKKIAISKYFAPQEHVFWMIFVSGTEAWYWYIVPNAMKSAPWSLQDLFRRTGITKWSLKITGKYCLQLTVNPHPSDDLQGDGWTALAMLFKKVLLVWGQWCEVLANELTGVCVYWPFFWKFVGKVAGIHKRQKKMRFCRSQCSVVCFFLPMCSYPTPHRPIPDAFDSIQAEQQQVLKGRKRAMET